MRVYVSETSLHRPNAITVHVDPSCKYAGRVHGEWVEVRTRDIHKSWKKCQYCFG